jgi:hypothetical protein
MQAAAAREFIPNQAYVRLFVTSSKAAVENLCMKREFPVEHVTTQIYFRRVR